MFNEQWWDHSSDCWGVRSGHAESDTRHVDGAVASFGCLHNKKQLHVNLCIINQWIIKVGNSMTSFIITALFLIKSRCSFLVRNIIMLFTSWRQIARVLLLWLDNINWMICRLNNITTPKIFRHGVVVLQPQQPPAIMYPWEAEPSNKNNPL